MKEKILTLLFTSFFITGVIAQNNPLIADTINLQFRLNFDNSKSQIVYNFSSGSLKNAPLKCSLLDLSLLDTLYFGLDQADLVFKYRLNQPEGKLQDYRYLLKPNLLENGKPIWHRPKPFIEFRNEVTETLMDTTLEYRWLNALEERLDPDFSYTLNFSVLLLWDGNCEKRPSFNPTQQSPHYVGFLAGVGFLVAGQVLHNNAKKDYLAYQELWEDDTIYPTKEDQAQRLYNDVMTQEDRYQTLSYIGFGIIALDAAWYTYRLVKHKNKVKPYNLYCDCKKKKHTKRDKKGKHTNTGGIDLRPFYGLSAFPDRNGAVAGVRLRMDF